MTSDYSLPRGRPPTLAAYMSLEEEGEAVQLSEGSMEQVDEAQGELTLAKKVTMAAGAAWLALSLVGVAIAIEAREAGELGAWVVGTLLFSAAKDLVWALSLYALAHRGRGDGGGEA